MKYPGQTSSDQNQVQAMVIECELPLYCKTQSFIEGQQTATIYEASIIAEVTPAGQTLNEPTHGSCKVGWWGDLIVHQYDMRR